MNFRISEAKELIYPLCVMAAGILWGCMGILVRSMNKAGFNSMEIVTFRAIVTAIIMVLILLITNRKALRIKLKDVWCFIGTGIVSIVFFNVCYFSCMKYTTLGTAAILLYTAPTFVTILSAVFFKEKFGIKNIICVMLAFIGCALVSGGFNVESLSVQGLLYGLGAGFGYALYSIFSKFAIGKGYGSLTITTYTFIFATIGSIPFIKINHFAECVKYSEVNLLLYVVLVIFNTVVAYLLYTKGLSGMEGSVASIIASIEPVVAAVVGVIMYGEILTPLAICGMGTVLLSQGVSLWHRNNLKREDKEKE